MQKRCKSRPQPGSWLKIEALLCYKLRTKIWHPGCNETLFNAFRCYCNKSLCLSINPFCSQQPWSQCRGSQLAHAQAPHVPGPRRLQKNTAKAPGFQTSDRPLSLPLKRAMRRGRSNLHGVPHRLLLPVLPVSSFGVPHPIRVRTAPEVTCPVIRWGAEDWAGWAEEGGRPGSKPGVDGGSASGRSWSSG